MDREMIEKDLHPVFQRLRQMPIGAEPHLGTRIMARWRKRQNRKSPFWKRWALAYTALSAVVAALTLGWWIRGLPYRVLANRSFVVRFRVSDLPHERIAKAQIRLPDGVSFDLDDLPELKRERQLTVNWTKPEDGNFFPLVLQGSAPGMKTVTVRFLDQKDGVVAERSLEIEVLPDGNTQNKG